jgi:hypothetical protein
MKRQLHGNPYGCLQPEKSPLPPFFKGGQDFGLLLGRPKTRAAKSPFEKGGLYMRSGVVSHQTIPAGIRYLRVAISVPSLFFETSFDFPYRTVPIFTRRRQ